jgi:hypothetical protein
VAPEGTASAEGRRRAGSGVDLEPEDVGPAVVADHVEELEGRTRLGGVDVGEQDPFTLDEWAGEDLRKRCARTPTSATRCATSSASARSLASRSVFDELVAG